MDIGFGTATFNKLVILWVGVLFLCTSCRAPLPAADRFGDDVWEVFSRSQRVDAYRLKPFAEGSIAGPTTYSTSAKRDPHVMHRIWSFMQSEHTFDADAEPLGQPVPQYLIRYGRAEKSIDVVFDLQGGWLSMYETGDAQDAEWISILPAKEEIASDLERMFGLYQRDFPQKAGT